MIHNKEYKEVQGTSQSPSGMLGRGRRVPDTQLPQHSESAMRPCSRTSPPRTDLFLPTLQINQKKKKKKKSYAERSACDSYQNETVPPLECVMTITLGSHTKKCDHR